METSFISDGPIEGKSGGARDLFSELHGDLADQLKEKQIENERLIREKDAQMKQFGQLLVPLFQRLDINCQNFG